MISIGNIRAVTEKDLEIMRSWRNHPEISSKMYTRHEISADEHRSWWARTAERCDQEYYIYECYGAPLGVVSFTQIDLINKNCFWAFYAKPSSPRGTGSRMEFLALQHAFGTLQLHKISCEVLAFNEPVIRLHKKFGFQVEGVFRSHHKVNAQYADIVRLAIFDREWDAVRAQTEKTLKISSESE